MSEWCVFWMSATWPSSSPSTNQSSHSGRSRSSRPSWTRVVSATSCSHEPGLRQRGVAHVVRDVEAVVVDPDRAALLVGHGHQPAAEARQQLQPRQHEVAHLADAEAAVGVEERLALEHAHRADVHRVLEPLQVQEAGVERGEPVVLGHRPADAYERDGCATVYGACLESPTAVWTHLARAGARARRAARACPSTATSTVRRRGSSATTDRPRRSSGGCTRSPVTERPPGSRTTTSGRRSSRSCRSGVDPHALRLGDEVRPLTALWDGLECYAAYGDELEPQQLASHGDRAARPAARPLRPRRPRRDRRRVGARRTAASRSSRLLLDQLTN